MKKGSKTPMKNAQMKNRVLLINANEEEQSPIAEALQACGFVILSATTGQKALRTIRDHLVDVVILDLRTPFGRQDSPGENTTTLEAITDANPFLPVVLTCDRSEDLDHATALMADMVLTHPVKPARLLDAVHTVTGETLRQRAHRKAGGLNELCLVAS